MLSTPMYLSKYIYIVYIHIYIYTYAYILYVYVDLYIHMDMIYYFVYAAISCTNVCRSHIYIFKNIYICI